jgi:asparagine synthase (glutamine-hydrolysing)
MCGVLAGLFEKTVDPGQVDQALSTLVHRGPDSTNRWISDDGLWLLGHTRLSIIGLNNGTQPISNRAGDVRIVVNGEFYGYRAIRDDLRDDGFQFSTDSDSEILLHLYQREGMGAVEHLRGEFAGVIADRRNQALIAIRDRFGIKPLFYTVHDGSVLFASEIKALLAMGVPARWDRESAFQESFLFRPAERTLFENIFAVPPGHYAIAQRGHVAVYPYWDSTFPTARALADDDRSEEEIVAGFREVLSDAVSERLIADVEVASYLSGGIDSCAVLGLAQQSLDRPIRAYTLTFEDALYDESSLAQEQAALSGAAYHPVPVTSQDLAGAYEDAVWHAETVFSNGHGVAKYLLSRAVRDAGIKVVFTGEGADEMLGGYPPFRRDVLLYNSEGQDPEVVERLLAEMDASNQATRGMLTSDAEPGSELEAVSRRLGWVPSWIEVFSDLGRRTAGLIRDDFLGDLIGLNPYELTLSRLPLSARLAGRDPLNQSLYLWSHTMLNNFILTFLGDRMEMAHSIEGRVPFLDHKVAEYAAGIPIQMKIKGMREKHVLREATRDVIIEPVYNREKHPFTTPPAQRDDDPMRELFCDVFASSALDDQPVFDPAASRVVLDELPTLPPEDRFAAEGVVQRILCTALMHERFNMSA